MSRRLQEVDARKRNFGGKMSPSVAEAVILMMVTTAAAIILGLTFFTVRDITTKNFRELKCAERCPCSAKP